MRYITLEAVSDEYDPEPGFKLAGCPSFEGFMADREGGLIAHDVLEHQNGVKAMGPVWDELEAIGAIWQVRGRHGDLANLDRNRGSAYSVIENVASDITRMFSDWTCEWELGPGGLKTGSRPHDYDDDFRDMIEIARRGIRDEYTDMGNGSPGEDENGWNPQLHADLERYLTLALHRMRAGFRKAERRFGTDCYGHGLYCRIRDAVHRASRHIDYEGQQFRLAYGKGEARCYEIFEREEY